MTTIATSAAAPTVYSPAPTKADVLADALGRIITGRPLPEALRPVDVVTGAPATVQEGIARILTGARAG